MMSFIDSNAIFHNYDENEFLWNVKLKCIFQMFVNYFKNTVVERDKSIVK